MERKELELEIKKARKQLLDIIELSIGSDHQKWPAIRSYILKVFGKDGLSKFHQINQKQQSKNLGK